MQSWQSEMEFLVREIMKDSTFHPHPGYRCRQCLFFSLCPAMEKTDASYLLIHDPKSRFAAYYAELFTRRERLNKDIRETRNALIAIAEQNKIDTFTDLDGVPILTIVTEYRLPGKNTRMRNDLESLLAHHGFRETMTTQHVLDWLQKSQLADINKESIRRLMKKPKRIKLLK